MAAAGESADHEETDCQYLSGNGLAGGDAGARTQKPIFGAITPFKNDG